MLSPPTRRGGWRRFAAAGTACRKRATSPTRKRGRPAHPTRRRPRLPRSSFAPWTPRWRVREASSSAGCARSRRCAACARSSCRSRGRRSHPPAATTGAPTAVRQMELPPARPARRVRQARRPFRASRARTSCRCSTLLPSPRWTSRLRPDRCRVGPGLTSARALLHWALCRTSLPTSRALGPRPHRSSLGTLLASDEPTVADDCERVSARGG
mmetsp:Transcript_3101/g.12605  ORF Transcript_3101/g.12605 Transcript_3101/m.12605 type:complete len:213 (-) Transcript_3101:152-790(-)